MLQNGNGIKEKIEKNGGCGLWLFPQFAAFDFSLTCDVQEARSHMNMMDGCSTLMKVASCPEHSGIWWSYRQRYKTECLNISYTHGTGSAMRLSSHTVSTQHCASFDGANRSTPPDSLPLCFFKFYPLHRQYSTYMPLLYDSEWDWSVTKDFVVESIHPFRSVLTSVLSALYDITTGM